MVPVCAFTLQLPFNRLCHPRIDGTQLGSAACVLPLLSTVAYDLGFGPNTMSYVPFFFAMRLIDTLGMPYSFGNVPLNAMYRAKARSRVLRETGANDLLEKAT